MAETADRELIARQFLDEIKGLDKLRDEYHAADARLDEARRDRQDRVEAYIAALVNIKKAGWGATTAGLEKMGHVMPSNLKRNRRNNNASADAVQGDHEISTEASSNDDSGSDETWDQR